MPWHIEKRNGEFCIVKDGETTPIPGGCHETEQEANDQLAALYANESGAGKGRRQEFDGLQYKTIKAEFKARGDKGEYEGHFSVFSNLDDGGDVMMPGAFAKTIADRRERIKPMYMHDWTMLLGPAPDVLAEDGKGLYAKGRLTLENFYAGQIVWPLLKDNALNEGSIGYETIQADWDQTGVRLLKEVKLYEFSFVPLGMNSLTQIQAVKMLRQQHGAGPEELLQAAMVMLKAGARHSKDDMQMIQDMHDMCVELGAMCTPKSARPATETTPSERAAPSALARAAEMRAASRALAQLQDTVRRSKR